MKNKKAGSKDVPVPGRSWKQKKTFKKAVLALSDEVPHNFICLKTLMTPLEGVCHDKQGSKSAA